MVGAGFSNLASAGGAGLLKEVVRLGGVINLQSRQMEMMDVYLQCNTNWHYFSKNPSGRGRQAVQWCPSVEAVPQGN